MFIDLDGQNAHDIIMQAHQTLHLLHGGSRCIGAQKGIVTLAVLVDLVGHRLDAPVLVINDGAAVVSQDCAEMFDKTLGLRVRQVLTGNEDMLVKRHVHSLLFRRIS